MKRKCMLSYTEIVRLYTEEHKTCAEIGILAGVSRQTIAHHLKWSGVKAEQGERVEVMCEYCGVKFAIARCLWKKKQGKRFCTAEHYYAFLGQSGYEPWRQGQRLARAIVAQHFDLQPAQVVHHKDSDNRNNDRANLLVFASQADHMRHHRGGKVQPLWDGLTVVD